MTEVIGVRFRGGCKEYYFDPHGIAVKAGQFVIVETAQGTEYAQCLTGNHEVDDGAVVRPLRTLVRIATENDRRTMEYNRQREKDAFGICQRKIAERGLDMKLVRVECSFDGSKIVFFFTSEGRVDFRELVRDLAGVFRARIELRQIGVRDEAKMLGGLGICGRPFCCAQFLDDLNNHIASTLDRIEQLLKNSDHNGPVKTALYYIEKNYSNSNLSIIDIAQHCNVNANYLCGMFKSSTGKTINNYVNNLRIEASKKMLLETNLHIAQIADSCGFNDSKYFCKVFGKYVSLTPTEFRKKYK